MRRSILPVLLVSCCILFANGAKILVNYTPMTKSHAMGMNRYISAAPSPSCAAYCRTIASVSSLAANVTVPDLILLIEQ